MKNILITGAKGFLGCNFAKYYNDLGNRVYGIGHGEIKDLQKYGLVSWINSDITIDKLKVFDLEFDIIIHCGGSGSVGFSVEFPMNDYQRSIDGTLAILEYMRLYNQNAVFIYPSSPAIQGVHNDSAIKENFRGIPASPYGVHKKIAEDLCWSYSNFYNLKILILRFFSIYGEGLRKQLFWDALNKIEIEKEPVFFGTGNETRDWIHISDAVEYTNLIIQNNDKYFDIYNIGTGVRTTISQTLSLLNKEFNLNKNLTFNQIVKKGDPKYYLADISKMNHLGFIPKTNLSKGIKLYINWYEENK